MEDRLAAAGTDVDEHAIVLETGAASDLSDEIQHPLSLVRGKLGDVAERVDVPLREDEQVRLRLRIEVAYRDEAVRPGDVVALAYGLAEQAIVRQRGSPPP